MSGQIGEGKINEVRERTDIIELVSQYVSLKRSGANHMGLCPFHSEKSPSFSVHAGRQFFHCFGCGVGGDAFSFLMKVEGLAFPDAARRLAERAGIELEERQLSPEEEQRQQQRERLFHINELAADFFHHQLMDVPTGEPGRQYLKRRGYGRKAAGEYRLGYAVDLWESLSGHLKEQGVSAEDIRCLGLIRPGKDGRSDYDLFRGRLIFPIYDLNGRVLAFGGRVLDDSKPKYINSPESPIYHKGRVLYGLYQARQAMRQSGEVILVEGYFDQLALYRAGYPQVVATCGTALTGDHAKLLKRYVQRVLLLFDQDTAGRQATFKAMAALQNEGVPASVIELASGEDPDSFVQRFGTEAFRQQMEKARPAMDLFMEDLLGQAGSGVEERVRATEQVVVRLAGLTSSLEQDLYLKDLAGRSGIDLQLLKQKLDEEIQRASRANVRQRPESASAQGDYPESPPLPEEYTSVAEPVRQQTKSPTQDAWGRVVDNLFEAALLLPEERQRLSDIGEELFPSEAARGFARELASSTKEPNDKALIEDFSVDYHEKVRRFALSPREKVEGVFDSLLAAVKRDALQKEYEKIGEQLKVASQSGEEELHANLQREFTRLKNQLKL